MHNTPNVIQTADKTSAKRILTTPEYTSHSAVGKMIGKSRNLPANIDLVEKGDDVYAERIPSTKHNSPASGVTAGIERF